MGKEAAEKLGIHASSLSRIYKEERVSDEMKARFIDNFGVDIWAASDEILKSLPTDVVKGIEAGDAAARLAKRETALERDRRLEIENAKLEAENKLLREMVDKLMGQLEKK
jgi:hypothetical protein